MKSSIPTVADLKRHATEQQIVRESKAAFNWSWLFCLLVPFALLVVLRIEWLNWLISAAGLWTVAIICQRKMSSIVDEAILLDQCYRELDDLPSCRKYLATAFESARSRAGWWYCFGQPCSIMKYIYALVAIAAIYSELIR